MDNRIHKAKEKYRAARERLTQLAPGFAAGLPDPEAIPPEPVLRERPAATDRGSKAIRIGEAAGRRPKMRGLGRVYQRGNVWWVQYCFRGKVYRETSGSTNRRDAVNLVRRRLEEMGRGRLVGPDVERTTFEDLAKILTDDYKANRRKSLDRAEDSLEALRAFFGTSLARDITFDRLNAYIVSRLEARRKPATVRNELAALKRAFRLAERAGRAVLPPFPTLTVHNTRSGFFEAADFHRVCTLLPEHLRPVATFMYLTGWRKQEVLGLTWGRIDFSAGLARLEPGTTKNNEGRTFPFAALPPLEDLLRKQRLETLALERRTGQPIPWVFHRRGMPIKSFRRAWETACKNATCPERIPHDLRRTAVRNLERAGVPRSVAMKLTGHKTESVYRRYAIVGERDLSEGVAKLAALRPLEVPAPDPIQAGIDTVLAQSQEKSR